MTQIESVKAAKGAYFVGPDGRVWKAWAWRIVHMNRHGFDRNGWFWGWGSQPLWYCSDGIDSITVRAPTMEAAHEIVLKEGGYPPKIVGRFNWGREYENG